MGTERLVKNKKIRTPRGALEVLRAIDMERIKATGLKARIVFYARYPTFNQSLEARFDGKLQATCLEKKGLYQRWGEYILPSPRFQCRDDNGKDVETNNFPFEAAWSNPADVELMLDAETPEDFDNGFLGIRYFISDFIDKGWSHYNPNHTSIFWFHLAKEDLSEGDTSVLDVDVYGFNVFKSEVDGIQVFTSADLQRFADLGEKKE